MARRLPNCCGDGTTRPMGQNEERSQISTALGESYARDRQEKLRAAAPTAPDDPMHAALEQYNEEHEEAMDVRAGEQLASDEKVASRKYGIKLRKELAIPEIREEAIRLAALTPTLEDDESARRLPEGLERIIENSAEQPDDFADRVLKKYGG